MGYKTLCVAFQPMFITLCVEALSHAAIRHVVVPDARQDIFLALHTPDPPLYIIHVQYEYIE